MQNIEKDSVRQIVTKEIKTIVLEVCHHANKFLPEILHP